MPTTVRRIRKERCKDSQLRLNHHDEQIGKLDVSPAVSTRQHSRGEGGTWRKHEDER